MGRSYWFECSKCGYRAKVSGGADRGLHFFVQTVACHDCKELYDAVTRLRVPEEPGMGKLLTNWRRPAVIGSRREHRNPPAFDAVLNRLLYRGICHFKWVHFKTQCPVSPLHRVATWNAPANCPRCGLHLERNAMPFRIWE